MHNNGNGGQKVLVLYQVANSIGDSDQYNAFEIPRVPGGIKLSTVKKHCVALRNLSRAGPAGYQWRVRVDDRVAPKSASNSKTCQKYSWWDIQDDNAPLPVKDVTFTELSQILTPPKQKNSAIEHEDTVTKAASGAIRSLGKAMNKVAATVEGNSSTTATDDNFPRVSILVFKLLDLIKIYDSFSKQSGQRSKNKENSARQPTGDRNSKLHCPSINQVQVRQHNAAPKVKSQPKVAPTPRHQDNLLNFNDPTPQASNSHQHVSYPTATNNSCSTPPETRVDKIVREYKQKKNKQDLVWDDIDQRFVTPDSKSGGAVAARPMPAGRNTTRSVNDPIPKVKGISLDVSNAVGKSAHVANAIQTRVNDMKEAQQKALNNIREREMKKKQGVAEEDQFRHKVEPIIKVWSEEHGKKKHLSALLANLHTVLWPGAKWTQVNLGDLLDEKKCRHCFHKASRVVHPDKTMRLNAEQRFLAKRIFDALKQAKSVSDNA